MDKSATNLLYFEDVSVGDKLPDLSKGPLSPMHLLRWSASMENWHRIHFDQQFATQHEGLPDILVHGTRKQHVLCQRLKDWAGPNGWIANIKFQYRDVDLRGDVITAFGEVVGKEPSGVRADAGNVTCTIGIRNSRGLTSTIGSARVLLPLAGSGPVKPPVHVK